MRTPRGYASVERVRHGWRRDAGAVARRALAISLAAAAVFAAVTVAVARGDANRLDSWTWFWVVFHRHHPAVTVARLLTDVLSPPVDIAVLLVAAWRTARRRTTWRPLLVAVGAAAAVTAAVLLVKGSLGRPPPPVRGIPPAVALAQSHGGSYPSGHTATVLVGYGTLVLLGTAPGSMRRRLWLAAIGLLTLLVGASLVYAGYHWVSDTIGAVPLAVALLAAVAAADPSGRVQPPTGEATATSFADTLSP
jgi:undecaprenyl-diphosphatase